MGLIPGVKAREEREGFFVQGADVNWGSHPWQDWYALWLIMVFFFGFPNSLTVFNTHFLRIENL